MTSTLNYRVPLIVTIVIVPKALPESSVTNKIGMNTQMNTNENSLQ